jgi:hypothetical protein
MAFVEDFSAFLSTSEFAVSATLAGAPVRGIFENAYQQGAAGFTGMASTQPVLTLATSDVPAQPVGASLVVNSTSYTIAHHEPDGTGMSVLFLERAA